jgi:glutamate racemase
MCNGRQEVGKTKNDAPIGVFDSGIGGLTVVSELLKLMPEENIIYFGDTARTPYGSRPSAEIVSFMMEILRFFTHQKVKLAVMACNTMTAVGLSTARKNVPFPLVGVDTGVQAALQATMNNKIGVIATETTIASGNHGQKLKSLRPSAILYPQACPKFVPLIEAGELTGSRIEAAAYEYLQPLQEAAVDSLILGCTHYPFIAPVISHIMGPAVRLIDPAKETALQARDIVRRQGMPGTGQGSCRLCFSADLDRVRRLAECVIESPLPEIALINLQDFSWS